MGRVEDGHARRLVDPAALHPHEAVLDHVDASDAVAAADGVQPADDGEGAQRLAVDAGRHAGVEPDRHVFNFIGGLLGRSRHAEIDQLDPVDGEVFQLARFVADVQAVLVRAVGLGCRGLHGDVLLPAIGDHLAASGEAAAELLHPPGRDHPHGRLQGLGGQLETALVVALARGPVDIGVGADLAGNLQADLRDQRPGDRRAQQVDLFVLRLPLQDGKGEIAAQFLAGVDDLRRAGADLPRLLEDRLAVFAGLAQIDVHCVDVVALILDQPVQDDRGVQSAGIGQNAAWHDNQFFRGSGRCRAMAAPRNNHFGRNAARWQGPAACPFLPRYRLLRHFPPPASRC